MAGKVPELPLGLRGFNEKFKQLFPSLEASKVTPSFFELQTQLSPRPADLHGPLHLQHSQSL